jgi:hypothetical protein
MIQIELIRQLNDQLKLQDAKKRAYQEISTASGERLMHLKAESLKAQGKWDYYNNCPLIPDKLLVEMLKEDGMIECYKEPDGIIRVESYRVGSRQDVVIGYLRQNGEDEDFWHFYPSRACVLNAGMCRRLYEALAELNKALPR